MSQEKTQKGFLFNENNNKGLEDVSFYTLRLGMKSYFSTYKTMKNNFNTLKEDGNFIESQEYIEL